MVKNNSRKFRIGWITTKAESTRNGPDSGLTDFVVVVAFSFVSFC